MDNAIMERVDLFSENYLHMKRYSKFEYNLLKMLSSLLYANEGKQIDAEAVLNAKKVIKDNTGLFSQFKGNAMITVATQLALSEQPEELFKKSMEVYRRMKEEGFSASDFLTIAAIMIANQKEEYDYNLVIRRSRAFYDEIKKQHFFLTGRDDYIFTTMLAMTDLEILETTKRMENFHQELKKEFFSGNGIQAMTEILVLSCESDDTILERVMKVYQCFKEHGYRFRNEYMLPLLGTIALLPKEPEKVVEEILEAHDYLKGKKGFSGFSMTTKERMMFAAALVSSVYVDDAKKNAIHTTLSTSITNIIIAQQTAIIAASSASAAAAASSSSS